MSMQPPGSQGPKNRPTPGRRPGPPPSAALNHWFVVGLVLFLVLAGFYFMVGLNTAPEVSYSFFEEQVDTNNIQEMTITGAAVQGKLRDKRKYPVPGAEKVKAIEVKSFSTRFPTELLIPPVTNRLKSFPVDKSHPMAIVRVKEPDGNSVLTQMVIWVLPLVLVLGFFWWMMSRAREQFDGGILGNFVKSPAKRYEKSKTRVTFDDVADLETAKAELEEIVEFLKNPEKFQRLGGQIPKGVLLMGPPGSGKTLLARAVAGEAGVPFYSISGSEFIQMFVGVGASRVRDMFKTAKENSPCILFIDEIDAVGRVRGAGLGGGHDEREQTLNQILTEMDGFTPNEAVIVMAATNRPDVLDPALLRPGRFDRHVTVDRPTRKGRLDILKVHVRNVPLADDVDLDAVARGTVGLTGADLRNLVNEAALLATREGKERVEMIDFDQARDKIIMGPKRDELLNVLSEKEKRMTAYHECGHALLAWLIPEADPLHKVTIIPRGRSLGLTQLLPEEDRYSVSQGQIKAQLTILLGGRAAEKVVFDELQAGVEDDLKKATKLARMMVTHWGMSDRLGPVAYRTGEEHVFLGKEIQEPRDFSEHTARVIDEEVQRILRDADERARAMLEENRDDLDRMADALIRHEVLSSEEIRDLISKPIPPKPEPESVPLPVSLNTPT